jgi:hypothetical protein
VNGGGDVHTEIWWETEVRRAFGRTGYRCGDSIGIALQEMGWSRYIDCIDLAEDREKWWDVV